MIKAALFDIDGTLLNSDDFIYLAFDHVLKTNNYPVIPREEMAKLMGLELEYIFSQFAPGSDTKTLSQALIDFQKENLHLIHPFPNAKAVLQTLQQARIRIAAITSRPKATTQASLKMAGIFPFFEIVYTLDELTNPKPDPEAIHKALSQFNVDTSEAVMIGDTQTDIKTGKNAGVITIGATYGMHGDKVKESNPDYLIDDLKDLLPILLKHKHLQDLL